MPDNSETDPIVVFFIALVYIIPLILLVGGLIIGTWLERRHFASIREREATFAHYPAVSTKSLETDRVVAEARLVVTSTVVSLDYCKRFLAKLRNIFGGRIRSYESLLDRAKRETILRLKESAPDFHRIVNLRIETSNIVSVHNRKKSMGGVEVLASGTAVRYLDGP